MTIEAQKQPDGSYEVMTSRGNARIYKDGRSWSIDWPDVRLDPAHTYKTLAEAKAEIETTLEELLEVDRARFKRELALAGAAPTNAPSVIHEMEGGDAYPYASPWIRLGAALLDGVINNFTLFIGWAIWACFTVPKAQTPGKQIVGIQVIDDETGAPASVAKMFFMRGLLAGFIGSLLIAVTLGVLAFMPLWDKRNRTIIDVISGTHVIRLPR